VLPPVNTDTPTPTTPGTQTEPRTPKVTKTAVLLPNTGETPPQTGLRLDGASVLLITFLGVILVGFFLGARVRKWLK
jgi:hypothetical protein